MGQKNKHDREINLQYTPKTWRQKKLSVLGANLRKYLGRSQYEEPTLSHYRDWKTPSKQKRLPHQAKTSWPQLHWNKKKDVVISRKQKKQLKTQTTRVRQRRWGVLARERALEMGANKKQIRDRNHKGFYYGGAKKGVGHVGRCSTKSPVKDSGGRNKCHTYGPKGGGDAVSKNDQHHLKTSSPPFNGIVFRKDGSPHYTGNSAPECSEGKAGRW